MGSGIDVFRVLSAGVLDVDLFESLESSLLIEPTLSLRSVSDDVDAVCSVVLSLLFHRLRLVVSVELVVE